MNIISRVELDGDLKFYHSRHTKHWSTRGFILAVRIAPYVRSFLISMPNDHWFLSCSRQERESQKTIVKFIELTREETEKICYRWLASNCEFDIHGLLGSGLKDFACVASVVKEIHGVGP